jgi:hypothetical protein
MRKHSARPTIYRMQLPLAVTRITVIAEEELRRGLEVSWNNGCVRIFASVEGNVSQCAHEDDLHP